MDEGMRPAEVARAIGTSKASVSRWRQAYEAGGHEAVAAKRHPGRKPRLTDSQRKCLVDMLLQGPARHGYRTELWTLSRVAEVIEANFGVTYHPCSVWYILRSLGWSCQKPERLARERDEDAIADWRRKDWSRIKKRQKARA